MPTAQTIVLIIAIVVLLFIAVKWVFLWRRVQSLGKTPPPPGWSPEPKGATPPAPLPDQPDQADEPEPAPESETEAEQNR